MRTTIASGLLAAILAIGCGEDGDSSAPSGGAGASGTAGAGGKAGGGGSGGKGGTSPGGASGASAAGGSAGAKAGAAGSAGEAGATSAGGAGGKGGSAGAGAGGAGSGGAGAGGAGAGGAGSGGDGGQAGDSGAGQAGDGGGGAAGDGGGGKAGGGGAAGGGSGGKAGGGSSGKGGSAGSGAGAGGKAGAGGSSGSAAAGAGGGVDPPSGGRYAAVVAPVDGETFVGSKVDLRFVGVGRDENNFQGDGPGAGHGQAASVELFVDGASVLTVDAAISEYWVFKGWKSLDLAPGDHTVFVRSIYSANPGPPGQVDSPAVTITVLDAPGYDKTIEMSGDLTLTQAASLVGTEQKRIRVNGHGHRIVAQNASAAVNWQYVDFYDLGDPADTASNGVDIATTGNVTVRNCRFDYSNPVHFSLDGGATAEVRGNLFRSNMRQPLGQLPYGDSYPTVSFTGGSTGKKTFAGNNMGAGWVDFQAVKQWTIGGDTDADSNVLIGPRVGIHVDYQGNGTSTNIVIKRNFSHHIYYGGWSQGNNLEGGGNSSLVAQHNALIGSSWTIRGMAGEFAYNLVLMAGEDWMWLDTGAFVHHNLFIGGDNNRSGLYNTYDNTKIRIQNNTLDGMGSDTGGVDAVLVTGSENVSSNLFLNLPYTPIDIQSGTLEADYNLFFKSGTPSYSDARSPAHDVHADPMLQSPATHAYEFNEKAVWQRALPLHEILAAYRARYTPKPGSPAIDSGDPGLFGAGNDIGAIGSGAENASDQFAQ